MRPHTKFHASLCALCASAQSVFAGPLTPPAGPIAPTPGPEPRIPLNATNTPGDADSVFRISAPGSYYLTGNLGVPLGKSGIEIASNNVTIDLMGYNIQAILTAVKGISIDEPRNNLTIRNGTVSGFPQGGIVIGSHLSGEGALVEHIQASSNPGGGIAVGQSAVVRHCTASNNGDVGIEVSDASTVTACTAFENASTGIDVGSGCTVINCSAYQNTSSGISTGVSAAIIGCSAIQNDGSGISASVGSTVADCAVRTNGLDGIECVSACTIRGNNCSFNGVDVTDGAGVHATGTDNRIEGNNCTGADRGIVVDLAGNVIIRNTCSGNTTNWVIVANNYYGPIIDRTGVMTAAVNGSAAAGTLATTDPNANFSY